MRWAAAALVVMASGVAAADAAVPVQVTLWIDGSARGDAFVFVDDVHVWIPADELCEMRLCPAGGVDRNGERYVDLATLRSVLRFGIDLDAGEVRIQIDPAALPVSTVSLANHAPTGIEDVPAPSLFVNYAATLTSELQAAGFAEGGLSLGHALAYAAVSMPAADRVVRGLSNVAFDRRASMVRVVVGDDAVTGGVLGGSAVLAGVHVSRDFALDPYFVAQPTLTRTGLASAPSMVEVYRDGQLVKREPIPAGPFRVQDIAGATSANVQVVLRDPLGAISQVGATMVAPPASALAPGLSQFDYSVGFARQQLATDSFAYGAPAAILVHRRGFAGFTAGARLEATTDRASGGASVVTSAGHLAIEASLAGSVSELGVSPAAAVELGWRDARTMFALLMRAVGSHYATIDLGPRDDRASEEIAASAAWSPTKTASLSAQLGFERHSVVANRAHVSLAAGVALGGCHVDFAVGVAWPRELDLSVSITRALGARTIATGYARQDGAGVAVSHAADQNRGLAYDATLQVGSEVTSFARADEEHAYGHVAATASYAGGAARAAVEVAGGLVVIGGAVHATRPVQGGFALVRVPGVAGVRAYLDNHLVGTTNAAGDLVVPDLQPFYGNRLRVDVRDLPMDLATGELERIVAPPRRGGSIIAFAAQHAAHVTGSLVGETDPSFGELVVDGTQRAPIGRDGAFELEGVPMGTHHAVVEVSGRRCTFAFTADRTETALGVVACVR